MKFFLDLVNNDYFILALALWELVWKGLAMWKAARLNKKYWFIALLFVNTIGIFPILYLVFNRNKNPQI